MMEITKLESSKILEYCELEQRILGETLGMSMINSELDNPYIHFLVCLLDGKIVGGISCYFVVDELEVLNFFVDDLYQRKGIGTALLDYVIKITSPKSIILEVRKNNIKGLSFYEKYGFNKIGERIAYYQDKTDALILKKILSI